MDQNNLKQNGDNLEIIREGIKLLPKSMNLYLKFE